MTQSPPAPDDRSMDVDELDLSRLLAALRSGWLIVLGCAVAAVLIQAVRQHGAAPIYGVEMEVAATSASPVVGDAPPADQPRRQGSRQPAATPLAFTLYVESLHTRDVADELAKDPEVMKGLFPGNAVRGGAEVQQYLLNQLSVNQDQRRHTFAILRLQSTRPGVSVRLLGALDRLADDHVRLNALARARQMIADLDALPNVGADAAAAQVRGEQQRIEAAALSTAPFAAQRLGGPAVQPKPLNRPVKSLVAALILGAAIGAAIALLFERATRRRARGGAPQ